MASPRNIYPTLQSQHSHQQDEHLSYGRSTRLESASYESNRTDLSVNSRDVVVADQWIVLGRIGEGSFGEVFEVRDINTKRHYAIKRETMKTKHPQLKFENIMYDVLAGGVGIPQCHWYGQFDGFDCIVMDLLGPNLNQVRENVSCMELDIAVNLMCQMVSIVEHIHNRGVIVRDVKPDNFLFSSNYHLPEMEMTESVDNYGMPITTYTKPTCRHVFDKQWGESYPRLYAVDFGLACYWRDPETDEPYPGTKKNNRSKTGTARYASINVHRGKTHSRRDDVESIGYILLDLLLGTLPWTGVSAKNSKIGWDRMGHLKVDTVMVDLCAGLPEGVLKFVEYPRSLQYWDQPDYALMRTFLEESLPGGAYSNVVKSSCDGESRPTDYYNAIQQEREEQLQRQQEKGQQQQPQQQQHRNLLIINNDDHNDMFPMDDVTNQLSTVTISAAKPAQEQRKNLTTSEPSLYKLLKRSRAKKVGWNTHKHDKAPWEPKTDWTNEEKSTQTSAKSWDDDGDDDQHTFGKCSLDKDDIGVGTDDGLNQHQQQRKYNHHASPRRSEPFQWQELSDGNCYQKTYPSSTEASIYRQQQQSGKQRRHSQPHYHQYHQQHRRYSNPSKPAATSASAHHPPPQHNTKRSHGVEGDQPPLLQQQPHHRHHQQQQRHHSLNANTRSYYRRRLSQHRNNHNNSAYGGGSADVNDSSKKLDRPS